MEQYAIKYIIGSTGIVAGVLLSRYLAKKRIDPVYIDFISAAGIMITVNVDNENCRTGIAAFCTGVLFYNGIA